MRAQRELTSEAQAATGLPATKAQGCVSSGQRGAPLGSPLPRIYPRILGYHVEVRFAFERFPSSPACRPYLLTVAVVGGGRQTSTNWVERYRLDGPTGRVALILPFRGQPPYRVTVTSQPITGRYGPRVERPLKCPGTGDRVAGCLRGYRPTLHAYPMPKPALFIRGLDVETLERSLAQVVADDSRPPVTKGVPVGSRCPSLQLCEVTYADPAFPDARYRVQYAITGQQLTGCWFGLQRKTIGALPYEDAGRGRLFLAGCASWLG